MKDDMFEQVKYDDYDSDEEEDTDIISRIINAPTRQVRIGQQCLFAVLVLKPF